MKAGKEKFTEFDHGRIVKLDEEIEILIHKNERSSYIDEKGYEELNLLNS